MTRWKRIALINFSALGGAVAALFVVPERTPVWLWGVVSFVVLIVLNVAAVRRRRSAEGEIVSESSGNRAMIYLGLALLVLDLVLSGLRWRH